MSFDERGVGVSAGHLVLVPDPSQDGQFIGMFGYWCDFDDVARCLNGVEEVPEDEPWHCPCAVGRDCHLVGRRGNGRTVCWLGIGD